MLVLAAAAFTTSMYLRRNEQNKQMEAVAVVGKNLEAIGMSGEEVLSAVAVAAQNAPEEASEEETTETETGYEEKDLEEMCIRDSFWGCISFICMRSKGCITYCGKKMRM